MTNFSKVGLTVVALMVAAAAAASDSIFDVRYSAYQYNYGAVHDAGRHEFVMCSKCAVAPLALQPPQKEEIHLSLAPKFAALIPENSDSNPEAVSELVEKTFDVVDKHNQAAVIAPPVSPDFACFVGSVHFDFNSYAIGEREQVKLNELAAKLNGRIVSVSGYTCDIGTKQYNQSLSVKRAIVVADFLKGKGVEVKAAIGSGDCCRLSEKDKALNRRVEITTFNKTGDTQPDVEKKISNTVLPATCGKHINH